MKSLARLDLGFQPRPRLGRVALGMLLVGVACASVVVGHYQVTLGRLARAQADTLASHRERPSVDPRRMSETLQRANVVALELARPWDRTFAALEAVDQPGVALLAIDPDPRRDELRITAESKDMAGMLGYLDQLRTQPAFGGVALQQHEVRMDDPGRPIRFTLLAQWRSTR